MENPTSSEPNVLPVIDGTIDDVSVSTSHYLRRHPIYFTIPLIVTVILEIIVIRATIISPNRYSFYSILLPLFLPCIGYSIARSKVQDKFMQQFAAANGFSYRSTGSLDGLDGSFFRIGHDGSVTDVVSGQFQGHPLSLFEYDFLVGGGKSESSYHYTIYKLQFDGALPDIMLKCGGTFFGESLLEKNPEKEMIKLEGDFNKYFSLSVSKGHEVDALEVFTPDVMEDLIEKAKQFSVEIVNDHLFIYHSSVIGTKQELSRMYALAQYFIEKLEPMLVRMNPTVVASSGGGGGQ